MRTRGGRWWRRRARRLLLEQVLAAATLLPREAPTAPRVAQILGRVGRRDSRYAGRARRIARSLTPRAEVWDALEPPGRPAAPPEASIVARILADLAS